MISFLILLNQKLGYFIWTFLTFLFHLFNCFHAWIISSSRSDWAHSRSKKIFLFYLVILHIPSIL